MSVGQFCNRDTIIVSKEDSIVDAAKLMRQHHVGSLVVVEKDGDVCKPIGIVTDRDLVVEVLAAEINPEDVSLGDIMSFELVTAYEQDGLNETLKHMRVKGVRRIPVVDTRGHLAGILSADDVLEILANELSELAKLANSEQQHEQKVRPPV
jgi:CBS domain-containing protein